MVAMMNQNNDCAAAYAALILRDVCSIERARIILRKGT